MAKPPPSECAQCGAPIPRNARACPECGADERTGWAEQDIYDGLDLPEDDTAAAHARFRKGNRKIPRTPRDWFWWTVAVVLLLAFIAALCRR